MIPEDVYQETLMVFLSPIRKYLKDPSISEIMVNGPFKIYIERSGKILNTQASFASRDSLLSAIRNIAQYVGKTIGSEQPILEARLPDGSRVEAILPPAAPSGPMISIRKYSQKKLSINELVKNGAISQEAADFLSASVRCKQNIVVAGGTGSGKTSLLNVLSSFIPKSDRVIVIEDSKELNLKMDHVVQLEARPADARGRGKVSIRDLFKASLRMRPDRIIVGEVRGAEAIDLLQAMTSGHGGCLSTVHATYPIDTLNRLETMALMSDIELPLSALRMQITSALNIIVQVSRYSDGSRCITHISEVSACDRNLCYKLSEIFVRKNQGVDQEGTLVSKLSPTGVIPSCISTIDRMGCHLPSGIFLSKEEKKRKKPTANKKSNEG